MECVRYYRDVGFPDALPRPRAPSASAQAHCFSAKAQSLEKAAEAQKFVDWVISPAGQNVIASYKIDGQQLFFPNANK